MRKNCKCYLFYVNFGATTFYHELTPEEARQKMHEYAREYGQVSVHVLKNPSTRLVGVEAEDRVSLDII